MSIAIVLGQMVMIFAMIVIGVYLFKRGHLSNESSRQLSWIIVNITNPITLLCAALKDENKIGAKELGVAALCFVAVYIVLVAFAYLIPLILGVEKDRRYEYRMLTIYGNVGFIGIPFASAVLGTSSLIYVAICGLVFNFIMYTYGMYELRAVADKQHKSAVLTETVDNTMDSDRQNKKTGIINSGTVMAVLTLIVYIANIQVPTGVGRFLEYIGNCTTFLSMIVLGVSVAQMIPAKVFKNIRLYGFILIRQIAVPIFIAFLLKPFGLPELMLRTIVIMVAMPAANMPLMVSKQFGIEEENLAAGIIFTTLASIITIPVVIALI